MNISLDAILRDSALLFIPLLLAYVIWTAKSIYDLKKNTIDGALCMAKFSNLENEISLSKQWTAKTEAMLEPDRELRKQFPIALDLIRQHGEALQTMRETLLLIQKEISIKLTDLEKKMTKIEESCFFHKSSESEKFRKFLLQENDDATQL